MKSMFFEEFEVGQLYTSTGRTITEADSTLFCMLSGDWAPLHCDAEHAKTTAFGARVVAGALGFALVAGAYARWGVFDDSALAMVSVDEWKFLAPIFIGDTLHVQMQIADKRLTSRPGVGLLDRRLSLINQQGKTVQTGLSKLLLKCRSESSVG